ncbi:fimbrial protein [Burkholderia cenocepacia]|uniref:fimbrial protein n=1 Tax=Burkholderia cenocepacia TaxID=95486 RepID=UPI001CF3BD51|nr:fimbrial protein [Burkholderia cenocepacia]MCA7926030.1 fimbrial protein [Burkholderia cenocepacia]
MAVSGLAFAGCALTGTRSAVVLLSGNIDTGRDAPLGAEIARLTWNTTNFKFATNCTPGPVTLANTVTPNMGPAVGNLYPTSIKGVSVRIGLNDTTVNGDMIFPNSYTLQVGPGSPILPGLPIIWPNLTVFYSLIKTGPIDGGVITKLPDAAMTVDGKTYLTVRGEGYVTLKAASCTTPDVSVKLGRHSMAEFPGVGATSKPIAFDLKIDNCPDGLKSIGYRFEAPAGTLDAAGGVVALNASSTAKGFGVKLMDGAGKAIDLRRSYEIAPRPGLRSYSVPLQGALYRTAMNASGGSADAVLTVTMSYL